MKLLAPLGIDREPHCLQGALVDLDLPLSEPVSAGLSGARNRAGFAVLHTGGSARYKQWHTDRFTELAAALRDEQGLGSVLVGARADRGTAAAVLKAARERGVPCVSFTGRTTLSETAALIRRAALFVGSDSGLAHLAIALGVPTTILFGPSDHHKWGIEARRHAVVRRSLPCAPCCIFGYHKPCRHVACMGSITVADVLDACRRVLRDGPPDPATARS